MKNKYDYLKSVIICTLSESSRDLDRHTKTKSATEKQAPRYSFVLFTNTNFPVHEI